MQKLDSVQKFIEIQGWLLKFFNSIMVQVFEKHDLSNRQ